MTLSDPASFGDDPIAGPIVGIVGCGVTGGKVASHVAKAGMRVAAFDTDTGAARRVAQRVAGVAVDDPSDLTVADLVVLCHPAPHEELAISLIGHGVGVVSLADEMNDLHRLLALDEMAHDAGVLLVIGAAMGPGFSGVLARSLTQQVPVIEELHVALHGTGGPACAHQHHRALGDRATTWHDGAWIDRAGGSGRELCWFPEPIGARDCYRAAVGDPLLLQRAFPSAMRISARVSATRRDRLTARLPMLVPPHAEGSLGAVRVEARGCDLSGARVTAIVGASGLAADIAAATAAAVAIGCHEVALPSGVHVLGSDALGPLRLLERVMRLGVHVQEFTGVARATTW